MVVAVVVVVGGGCGYGVPPNVGTLTRQAASEVAQAFPQDNATVADATAPVLANSIETRKLTVTMSTLAAWYMAIVRTKIHVSMSRVCAGRHVGYGVVGGYVLLRVRSTWNF